VKKCASCTKDLPDAALHCVFCGAKQPPAPAAQPSLAKTAFGYANEPPPNPAALGVAATMIDTARPSRPSQPPPIAPPPPLSPADAKTMFVSPAADLATLVPGNAYAQRAHPISVPPPASQQATMIAPQPVPAPYQPPPVIAPVLGSHASPPPPPMAIPAAQPPPYQTSQTGLVRGHRPFEPWAASLRIHMLVWGLLVLGFLMLPITTTPSTAFAWQQILNGSGWERFGLVVVAMIGLFSLICAALPMPASVRGTIAAVLGLTGAALPFVFKLPETRVLVAQAGLVLLIPGLILRASYRDAALPRLLITFGVVGVLVPFVLPQDGAIPLVTVFKMLIEGAGWTRVIAGQQLALVVILVMCLLAWLPAPITGGATLWAWLLILWPLVSWTIANLTTGDPNTLVDLVREHPYLALAWTLGLGTSVGSAYLVLIGYGLASLIGKQLE
jgi:hypothetical protein